jgi:hypothetical protein
MPRRPPAGLCGENCFSGIIHSLDLWREHMSEPTKEELLARIAALEKQAGSRPKGSLEFRIGEKGGVSVYGLGRFPVTLYYEQWIRLLDRSEDLRSFLEENKSRLKLKNAG